MTLEDKKRLNADECLKLCEPLEQFMAWAIMNAKNRGDHEWMKKWNEASRRRNVPPHIFADTPPPSIPTPKGYATEEGWKP
jgi:hypothetical protein